MSSVAMMERETPHHRLVVRWDKPGTYSWSIIDNVTRRNITRGGYMTAKAAMRAADRFLKTSVE